MILRKLYSPDDEGGGGDDPKKKPPPKGYKPTTPSQRRDWNDMLDKMQKDGVAGHKDLDQSDRNTGAQYIEKYIKENPGTSITSDMLPFIQYEQQQLRTGDSFAGMSPEQTRVIRKQLNPEYLKRQTPDPGTPFNSQMSRAYYPEFKKGDKSYGTDMEGYAKDQFSAKSKETTEGPINFLNSYYKGEEFHKRLGMEKFPVNNEEEYKKQMEYINQGIDHYKPFVISDGHPLIGSAAAHYPQHVGESKKIKEDFRFEEDSKRPDEDISTILSIPQAKKLGTNLYREVIPHEYTHNTRGLTEREEEDIIGFSKTPKEALDKYNKNKGFANQVYDLKNRGKDEDEKKHRYDVASDVFEMTDHDFSPNEKYADLNALRFLMYQQGIYDVRKGDMKKEDIEKAMKDPGIKDTFIMKRMLNNFDPENIVRLNNKIAFEKVNTDSNNESKDVEGHGPPDIGIGLEKDKEEAGDNSEKGKTGDIIPLPNYNDTTSRSNYLKQWAKKYGDLEGRGDTVLKVNEVPRGGSDTAKNLTTKAAKKYGLDPALLYSSAMEEGMSGLFKDKSGVDTKHRKPGEFGYQDYFGDKDFPINGDNSFGLNTFSERFPELVKGGYLPKEFASKFRGSKNEGQFNKNDFKSADDAITAKAAMLKYTQDDVEKYAKEKGIELTPKAKDFFTLAEYNSGEGGFHKLLKKYSDAGLLKDDKFLKERPNKEKIPENEDIYGHVIRRIKMADNLKKEKHFEE